MVVTLTEGVVSPRSAGLLERVLERVTDLVRVAAALDEGATRDGDRAGRDEDGSRLRDRVAALEALLAGVRVELPVTLREGVPVALDDGVPVALDEGEPEGDPEPVKLLEPVLEGVPAALPVGDALQVAACCPISRMR